MRPLRGGHDLVVPLLELPSDTSAIAQARAAVQEALAPWPRTADVVLATSELVANAVMHGHPPVTLAIDDDGATVRITVASQGGADPRIGTAAPHHSGGRGLAMVKELSDRWGWGRDGATLRVHAEFDRD